MGAPGTLRRAKGYMMRRNGNRERTLAWRCNYREALQSGRSGRGDRPLGSKEARDASRGEGPTIANQLPNRELNGGRAIL